MAREVVEIGGLLSNFARTPFDARVCGEQVRCWTAEALYQAQKAVRAGDGEFALRIAREQDPRVAKTLGRSVPFTSEQLAGWESGRYAAMRRVAYLKFSGCGAAGRALLATGDAELVEVAPWDAFWGLGPDGSGANWLGAVLMEVRPLVGCTHRLEVAPS